MVTDSEPRDAESSVLLQQVGLPDPLASLLDHSPSRNERATAWAKIASRLNPTSASERAAPPHYRLLWVASALALCMLLGLFWGGILSVPALTPQARPTKPQQAPAPLGALASDKISTAPGLRLASGAEFGGILPGSHAAGGPLIEQQSSTEAEQTVRFEDGSTITAKSGSHVEPLAMSERDVTLRLVKGAIDVHVVPGGARRWTVEAGVLSVEVVGTKFSVDRRDSRVNVRVTRGAVLVRSAQLADRVQRLVSDQALSVVDASRVSLALPPNKTRAAEPASTPGNSDLRVVEALLKRADAARLDGDLASARTHLERIVREFDEDARAGLAAYQLASVREQLGDAAPQVADAFAAALRRARGASLRQDCYWRLTQARNRAGQAKASRENAHESLREFPDGRYAERLRQQLAASQ